MRIKRSFFVLTFTFAVAAIAAHADSFFSGTGTTGTGPGGTNVSYYVASGQLGGTPRVQYVNAISDNATTGILKFYTLGTAYLVTGAGHTTTNIGVASSSVSSNDVVLIRYMATDTYQRMQVTTNSSTNITFDAAVATTPIAGDIIYKTTLAGQILVGDATVEKNANSGAIFNGQRNKPMLVEIAGKGTNTVRLNVISGVVAN